MACIRKRRGKWTIDYRDTTGRRRWKTIAWNCNDAENELSRIIRTNGGEPTNVWQQITFKDYAENWMKTYASPI